MHPLSDMYTRNKPQVKRYLTFDAAMKQVYGGKVFKIPIDGGFTCPNIDGTCGVGGCTYCTKQPLPLRAKSIQTQFEAGIAAIGAKWAKQIDSCAGFIPYFQAFTGTYAPVSRLRTLYDEALSLPRVVGLTVATRADCITPEVAALLYAIAKRTNLTVELGLQTIHDQTAKRINRGHDFAAFRQGFSMLAGITRCVHLINGLPGEDKEMMIASARTVSDMGAEQIKFHSLYLAKGTALASQYAEREDRGGVTLLTPDSFVDILVSQMEVISPHIVIARVNGDATKQELIAPAWCRNKFAILNKIDRELSIRDTYQGRLCNMHKNEGEFLAHNTEKDCANPLIIGEM